MEVRLSYYTISKTGATKGYQKLITVDADILQNPNYKTITDHAYYRQRITLHKQDEDGKGLGGIKFTLSADNLDDLYSFNVFDRNGDTASNAKTAGVYRISGGKLTTDYLRSGYSDCSRIAYGSWCSGDDLEETNSGKEIRFL